MHTDYSAYTPEQLLDALEHGGRKPDKALLEACLARREDLTPGLLAMLRSGVDETWDEDDPRWYREVHAGLLLIAFREEKALPLFDEIYRDEERDALQEWFDTALPHYGPLAVDLLTALLKDQQAPLWSRISVAEKLSTIARQHPETRERIVEVLRARLPRVDEGGDFVIPPLYDEDKVLLWTFVALALAEARDTASQPRVLALYEAGLIDETIMGDADAYLGIFSEDRPPRSSFDLIEHYYPTPPDRSWEAADEHHEHRVAPFEDADEEGGATSLQGYGRVETFVRAEQKVGRNDPCPCGSGRKYKRCCGT